MKFLKYFALCMTLLILQSCSSEFDKGKDYYNEKNFSLARYHLNRIKNSPKYSDSVSILMKKMDAIEDSIKHASDSAYFSEAINLYKSNKYEKALNALNKIDTKYVRPTFFVDSFNIYQPIVSKKIVEEKKRIAEQKRKEKEEKRIQGIIAQLDREIKSIRNYRYEAPKTATDIQMKIVLLAAYQKLIDDNNGEKDYRIKKKLKVLNPIVRQHRITTLPKLRRDYAKMLKKLLWEHDVDVKYWGGGNKYLELVGHIFASNRGIKTIQESLKDTPTMLRFKQVRYRWYDGASEYTYYNLETPSDSKDYYLK